jgi:hypothetical protein
MRTAHTRSPRKTERSWQGQAFYEDLLGLPSDLSCVYTRSLRPYLPKLRPLRLKGLRIDWLVPMLASLRMRQFRACLLLIT